MSKSLSNDHEYKMKLEDNFLKHIGYEHVENLCNELDLEKDQWEELETPENLNLWFQNFQKQEERRKRKDNRNLHLLRFMKRAAIFILLLIGVNYFLMANVEAYRIKVLNTMLHIQEKFTQIDYLDEDTISSCDLPKEWSGLYYPAYIPDGYQLTESNFLELFAYLHYTNSKGDLILFEQSQWDASYQIDSEEGEVSSIQVNDIEAILVKKVSSYSISWKQDEKVFYLNAGNMKLDQLVHIAESVIIKK